MTRNIKSVQNGDVLQHPDGRKFTIDNIRELPDPHGVGLDLIDEAGEECVAGHDSIIEAGWLNLGRAKPVTLHDALVGAGMIDQQTDELIADVNGTLEHIGLGKMTAADGIDATAQRLASDPQYGLTLQQLAGRGIDLTNLEAYIREHGEAPKAELQAGFQYALSHVEVARSAMKRAVEVTHIIGQDVRGNDLQETLDAINESIHQLEVDLEAISDK